MLIVISVQPLSPSPPCRPLPTSYLSQVLCGFTKKYHKQKVALRRPPPRHRGRGFDSIVGGPHKSCGRSIAETTKMHVIYENRCAYPAYLLSYRPKQ